MNATFVTQPIATVHNSRTDAADVGSTRHPHANPAWPKIGSFAQRGAVRPNRLGVSRARIRRVVDNVVEVEGLDAIDGTRMAGYY